MHGIPKYVSFHYVTQIKMLIFKLPGRTLTFACEIRSTMTDVVYSLTASHPRKRIAIIGAGRFVAAHDRNDRMGRLLMHSILK
jgi:hypothetical protein